MKPNIETKGSGSRKGEFSVYGCEDFVRVYQYVGKDRLYEKPEICWGSSGSVSAWKAKELIVALKGAIALAEKWDAQTGKKPKRPRRQPKTAPDVGEEYEQANEEII